MDTEARQLINFTIGAEGYGLELSSVREVIRMRHVTSLPRVPIWVKGIINLRGVVVPIIDLRERFGMTAAEYTDATRVIVVEAQGRSVGIVVDSASQVIRMAADQIDLPPPVGGRALQELITGIGKADGRLIILLDVEKVLADEELRRIAKEAAAARN